MTDAEIAIAVASAGAEVVRRRLGTVLARIDKGGGDFATSADTEAEDAMLAILHRRRPDDAVIAEESGSGGRAGAGRTWLIDPLCGTLNYAVQMRVVGVNAALATAEAVPAAAVADPFGGEVFWTDGRAAWRSAGGQDTRLVPSAGSGLVDLNLDPPFPSAPGFRAVILAADPGFVASFRPRVVSSSLALTWVAAGRRAAYLTDGDVWGSVHFSAGLAICQASGCIVTDLSGNPVSRRTRGVIGAADRPTHATLIGLVAAQRR